MAEKVSLPVREQVGMPLRTNSGLSITVSDIELLLAAGIDRNRAKRLATPGNVFDDILASTSRTPLRWISGEDAGEIDQAAGRHSTGSPPPPPSPLTLPPPPPRLPPDTDTALAAGSIGSVGNHGQGFQMSTVERKAVEKRAMCVASKQLREEGWVVENKSSTESYDLLCSRGNRRAYAEVKGTATCGEQIRITHAEVEFAREHQQGMLLVVVSGIEVIGDGSGGVSARGGTPTIRRGWAPQPSQLRPISYICTLDPLSPETGPVDHRG